MSPTRSAELDVEQIWARALLHAGLSHERVALLVSTESCHDHIDARFILSQASRIEVSLPRDVEVGRVAATLRHELQHVLQVDAHPNLYYLHGLAEEVAARVVPDSEFGVVYNSIPMESDANAAGHRFAGELCGLPRIQSLSMRFPTEPALRGDNVRSDVARLPADMIGWFANRADLCRDHAKGATAHLSVDWDLDAAFASTLNLCWPEAGGLWLSTIRCASADGGPEQAQARRTNDA